MTECSRKKVRGSVTLLEFGTTSISGFIVEETGFDEEGDYIPIEDDNLEIVADISAVRVEYKGRVKVIPKSGVTRPVIGEVFAYVNAGVTRKIIVDVLRSTNVKKGAVMWDIEGHAHPNISI